MTDIIQLLPDSIANQIAAGEVVQRPASVVKELMENSIDAGATRIQLIVKESGRTLVQVIDNGSGMSETDARMSLERHATSKIRTADDLFRLRTMGFRGEALASIAAVSQMELKTCKTAGELGTLIVVEGSYVKKQVAVAAERGTSISVRNLFYNIPARRNFLKSNPVEMRHIIDEFQRLALANSGIAFSLIQGDDLVYDLAPGKLSQRIVGIFGKAYQQQLAPVQEETEMIRVTGYVGRPESARKTRGEQFIFVNSRFIRSNYLGHAVSNAFEGLIPEGSFPFYVLFIEIDPRHIDVNVHPTKTEIKFDDERSVYAVMSAAVRQALGAHNLSPAIDFSSDVNIAVKLDAGKELSRDQYFDEQFNTLGRSNLENWEKLFDKNSPIQSRLMPLQPDQTSVLYASKLNTDAKPSEEKISFQLLNRYLVKAVSTGLVVIDQSAAHERVLFERFNKHLNIDDGSSQQSLFPQTITMNPSDFAMVMEMERELISLGFQFEVFGKNALLITGIPTGLTGSEKEVFEGLIEQFKMNQSGLELPLRENLARALAKRCAIQPGKKLAREEIEAIIAGLFACANPNFSPDGNPTFFTFDASKLESFFG
jgi:DNA mismatch repair protein MutL